LPPSEEHKVLVTILD
jgi:DNA-binding NarL/FixJ family response regulator